MTSKMVPKRDCETGLGALGRSWGTFGAPARFFTVKLFQKVTKMLKSDPQVFQKATKMLQK